MLAQTTSPVPLETYLWVAGAVVAFAVLAAFFVYLLRRSEHDVLGRALRAVEGWLERRAPRLWGFIEARFSTKVWYGLELTGVVAGFGGLVYLFAQITESWMGQDALYRLDRAVHQALAGRLSEEAAGAIELITHFGDGLMLVAVSVPLGLFFLVKKRWRHLAEVALVLWVGQAVPWILKWAFARERPDGGLAEALSYSFPSGHSFTAMTLWGFAIYLVWRWTDRDGVRLLAGVGLSLLILAVGLSRVLLSVHWVSDVAGGLTIGLAWLLLSLLLVRAVARVKGEGRTSNVERQPTTSV